MSFENLDNKEDSSILYNSYYLLTYYSIIREKCVSKLHFVAITTCYNLLTYVYKFVHPLISII